MNMAKSREAPARILIVDDDMVAGRMLGRILAGKGEICYASEGAAAIGLANELHPDVILLDVAMPTVDGFEICRQLKAHEHLADSAVIFVTAHTESEFETRALQAGAVDYITKPLNPPVVQARVNTHLTLKRQTDLLKHQASLLQQLASLDGLTGIANRRQFDDRLHEEWQRLRRTERPLGLAMIDIDHFKQYNDHYGHQKGDACLQTVATTLSENTRRAGQLAARFGGDEMAVLLPDTDAEQVRRFGERLCTSIQALAIPHGASPSGDTLTITVGVASCVPSAGQSPGQLLEAADKALYRAKQAGRNRCLGGS